MFAGLAEIAFYVSTHPLLSRLLKSRRAWRIWNCGANVRLRCPLDRKDLLKEEKKRVPPPAEEEEEEWDDNYG